MNKQEFAKRFHNYLIEIPHRTDQLETMGFLSHTSDVTVV